MIKENKKLFLLLGQYVFCLIVLFFVIFAFSGIAFFNFYTPLTYYADGINTLSMVKGLIENGSFWINPKIGVFGGYTGYDFPVIEQFNILILQLLNLFFRGNVFAITNAFFLLSFVSAAWSALFVFKSFKIEYPLALAGSVVFAILPYHFYRGTLHLSLSSYFVIPLIAMFCWQLYLGDFLSFCKNKIFKFSLISLLAVLIATSGIYYAFFSCFFIVITIIMAFFQGRKSSLRFGLVIIGIVVLILIMQMLPVIIYNYHNGVNIEATIRSPIQTEIYGLRIAHLLLPSEYNRISFLANISNRYDRLLFMSNNESLFSHLGLVSSLGFMLLIISLFIPKLIVKKPEIKFFARLNLAAVLFSCVGGFAVLFSFFVSDIIRSVNRVSIFIAFLSIFSFLYFIQYQLLKCRTKKVMWWLFSLLLIYIAAIDQINPLAFNNRMLTKQVARDQQFVAKIEKEMPNGAAVFELPFTDYPEPQVVPYNMVSYELLIPFLYSHHLKWSYGASKGRSIALWQEQVAKLPINQLMDQIILAGYSGLLIDKNGYADNGEAVISQIKKIDPNLRIVDNGSNFIFFDLRQYISLYRYSVGESGWECQRRITNLNMLTNPVFGKGFYPRVVGTDGVSFHWVQQKAVFTIDNPYTDSIQVFFDLVSLKESGSVSVYVNNQITNTYALIPQQSVQVLLNLTRGENQVRLTSTLPIYNDNSFFLDKRYILGNFTKKLPNCIRRLKN